MKEFEQFSVMAFRNLVRAQYQSAPGVFWSAITDSFRDYLMSVGRGNIVELIDKMEAKRQNSFVLADTKENLLKAAKFMRSEGAFALADSIEKEVAARD